MFGAREQLATGLESLERRELMSAQLVETPLINSSGIEGARLGAITVIHVGTDLMRTDGTAAGTSTFFRGAANHAGFAFGSGENVGDPTVEVFDRTLNNKYLFCASDDARGNELWMTDGTSAGTQLLMDINAGAGSSNPVFLARRAGKVFFIANNGSNGRELWVTDGTAAGTLMLRDINSGAGDSSISAFGSLHSLDANSNAPFFFTANNGVNGNELWVSDGTTAGTQMVKDINPWGDSAISPILHSGSRAFFGADNGVHGSELWTTDGTAAGTYMVKDLSPGAQSSDPSGVAFYGVNGRVLFRATDTLWSTDGTSVGTMQVFNEYPIGNLGIVNGKMLLTTDLGLLSSDGTSHGTSWLLQDSTMSMAIPLGFTGALDNRSGASQMFQQISFAGGTPQVSLWRTNGTSSGTTKLMTGPGFQIREVAMDVSNRFYFALSDGTLRRTDGTVSGTTIVESNFGGLALVNAQGITYMAKSGDGLKNLWHLAGSFDSRAPQSWNDVGNGGSAPSQPPTISPIGISRAQATRGQSVSLQATPQAAAGRSIQSVEWFEDTNRNGQFDSNSDRLVSRTTSLSAGVARLDISTFGMALGPKTYFARSVDDTGAASGVTGAQFEVTNATPTIGSVTSSKSFIKNAQESFHLQIRNASDSDGQVTTVRYYLDTNGDGVLNTGTDRLLGQAASSSSSGRLTLSGAALRAGAQVIFAVGVDNDGALSHAVSTIVQLNRPPVVRGVTFTPSSGSQRSSTFVFTATGVTDPDDGVKSVEMWIDSNNNGVFDRSSDRKIGAARRESDGTWQLRVSGRKLPTGSYRILAVVSDRAGAMDTIRSRQSVDVR